MRVESHDALNVVQSSDALCVTDSQGDHWLSDNVFSGINSKMLWDY